MKNIFISYLLLFCLCSFTKKKKPDPAFKKRDVTVTLATGYPNIYRQYYRNGDMSLGPFIAAGNFQASRRWSFGLQYTYQYYSTGKQTDRYYKFVAIYQPSVFSHDYQFEQKITVHTLMATVDYCYLNKGGVSLSSGIGLGYTPQPKVIEYYSNNIHNSGPRYLAIGRDWFPAFRIRFIHARVRIKENIGVSGGVGLGTDGLFSAGVYYTFKGKE